MLIVVFFFFSPCVFFFSRLSPPIPFRFRFRFGFRLVRTRRMLRLSPIHSVSFRFSIWFVPRAEHALGIVAAADALVLERVAKRDRPAVAGGLSGSRLQRGLWGKKIMREKHPGERRRREKKGEERTERDTEKVRRRRERDGCSHVSSRLGFPFTVHRKRERENDGAFRRTTWSVCRGSQTLTLPSRAAVAISGAPNPTLSPPTPSMQLTSVLCACTE